MFTPKYQSIVEQRREALRTQLQAALPPSGRFVLEVGCGHGHFLTAYAAAHPETTCIGIDLIGERIERATRKRDRARLGHLHFIQAEARLFLETLPEGASIAAVFILFPDPWPKLRHNKHRILQAPFLASLAARAENACPLHFRTDFAPYHLAARETIASDPMWELTNEPWPFEFVTVFQQRAEEYYSLVARRRDQSCAKSATAMRNAG